MSRSFQNPFTSQLQTMLARFLAVGGLSVGADVLVLFVLHSGFGVPLLVATMIGYFISLVINYTLNHRWVFGAPEGHVRRLVRYFVLVAFNVASTLAFVAGLTAAGVYYLLAKGVAIVVNAAVNFLSMRYWVFR
jgi:putative flippase GtrA